MARWLNGTCFFALIFWLGLPAGLHAALPECGETWQREIASNRITYTTSSGETYESYYRRLNRSHCQKDWTILVYMAADNDLSPFAFWDLYEMEAGYQSGLRAAGSTLKSDVIAQLDSPGNTGIDRIHLFQRPEVYDSRLTEADFRRFTRAQIASPTVQRLTEGAVGSAGRNEADRFENFLRWGVRHYPAKRYWVIVWGHGQGWAPTLQEQPGVAGEFSSRRFGGLAFNDSQGTRLDIPSLRRSLARVQATELGGRPFDVYASDACLMQMVEVATEVSETTRFVIGSTQVANYLGLPYRRILYEINSGRFAGERAREGGGSTGVGSGDEAYWVARMVPRLTQASLQANGLQGRHAVEGKKKLTLSSISTAELRAALLPSLERLSKNLLALLNDEPLIAVDLEPVLQGVVRYQGGAQDLGALLAQLQEVAGQGLAQADPVGGAGLGGQVVSESQRRLRRQVIEAASDAKAALHRMVLGVALGNEYSDPQLRWYTLGVKGVSTWLPASESDFQARFQDFTSSEFYRRVPSWGRWIEKIFGTPSP
jgi:hypothetical protein